MKITNGMMMSCWKNRWSRIISISEIFAVL